MLRGPVLFCFSREHLVKFGNHVQSQQCMLSFMSYLALRWVAFFRAVTIFIESYSVTLIYSLCVCDGYIRFLQFKNIVKIPLSSVIRWKSSKV